MAAVSWKNDTSGNWNTGSNWSNGAVPTSADGVTIGADSSATSSFTVTEDAATAAASTLTISGGIIGIPRPVTLALIGNTLAVENTVSLNNAQSFISGNGTLSVGGEISGFGTIAATGGVLDLTGFGPFDGPALAIGTTSPSTLELDLIDNAVAAPIAIKDASQTLEIGPAGGLIVEGIQNVTAGSILMAGGSLAANGGISLGTVNTSGSLSGFGTVGASLVRGGTSTADTITATGGTLTLSSSFAAVTNSGLIFDIANTGTAVPSTLALSAVPETGNTFTFLGPTGVLALGNASTFNDGVAGLNVSSTATLTNFIDLVRQVDVTVKSGATGTGTSGTVTLSDGAQLNLTGITNASGTWHVLTANDSNGGTDVFLSMLCYAAGTRILTATGERVVESLMQGDIVMTLRNGELDAQPIKWIGRRHIETTAHPHPEVVVPIRIQRGAFADNTPHADLLVSPDHAIFVDGRLICARQLVNGTTIRREQDCTSVDYYHVELDAHAILLAEGLPAESYLDTGNRGFFGNSDAPLILHPDLTDESDYPAREAGSCAPFASDEANVRPVWQRLADRAAALGLPVPEPETTTDAAPLLIAKGRTVKPVFAESGLYIFALPQGATEVRLMSHSAAPTDVRPWLEDRRRLGLYVERIVLRSVDEVQEVPVDHPNLSHGWWAVEPDGPTLRRWTDGNAVLPLPAMDGPTMLEVRAGSADLLYPVQPVPDARAA
jgi:Hint domain-containing protein